MTDEVVKVTGEIVEYEPIALSKAQVAMMSQKTPKEYILTRKGPKGIDLKYMSHARTTQILNEAFAWRWNWEIVETWFFPSPDNVKEVAVLGRLTVQTPAGPIIKTQYGSNAIWPKTDVGDALKGASSRGLRKAASLLGIGLDLYAPEDDQFDKAVEEVLPPGPAARLIAVANKYSLPLNTKKVADAWTNAVLGEPTPISSLSEELLLMLEKYIEYGSNPQILPAEMKDTEQNRKAIGKAIVNLVLEQKVAWDDAEAWVYDQIVQGEFAVYTVEGKYVCGPWNEVQVEL